MFALPWLDLHKSLLACAGREAVTAQLIFSGVSTTLREGLRQIVTAGKQKSALAVPAMSTGSRAAAADTIGLARRVPAF